MADGDALLARAQKGDRDALGTLLTEQQRACYDLALCMTGNDADAEDVCQDAFSRAARDIAAGFTVRDFRSWLLSIVVCAHRNRLDSEVARRRRERNYAMAQKNAAAPTTPGVERDELRKRLDASLGRLPEDRRLPIVLHYRHGLSYAQAAKVLEVPEGTVATNIRRGLEELKGLMTAAGYACTLPAMTGALGEGLAVSVPAGLTAFIQSLTVAAEGGAAAVGKAAAGAAARISARISSRLAAKKAAGLALGWKLGTVVTAAAIGGAAVVAVNSGMLDGKPQAPAVTAQPPTPGRVTPPTAPAPIVLADADCPSPRTHLDGKVIFDDNFDGPTDNWELVAGHDMSSLRVGGWQLATGRSMSSLQAVTADREKYWGPVRGKEVARRQGALGLVTPDSPEFRGYVGPEVTLLGIIDPRFDEAKDSKLLVGIRSVRPVATGRIVIEARFWFMWSPPNLVSMEIERQQVLAVPKPGPTWIHDCVFHLWRCEMEPAASEDGKEVYRCREFVSGRFLASSRAVLASRRFVFAFGGRKKFYLDRVTVKEFGGEPPEEGAP